MSHYSCQDTQSCIEMWRNAVPTTRQQKTNSQGAAYPVPSTLSSDNSRPPSALSSSDVAAPSALSDNNLYTLSALSSEVGSVGDTIPAMTIISCGQQGKNHGHNERDHTRKPISRLASFSSTLAENGSAFSLASKRAIQLMIEREQIQNKLVQEEIEAAEQTLARFMTLVAERNDAERQDEELKVSHSIVGSQKSASGNRVTFTAGNHPEIRKPLRSGTPTVLPILCDGYFADDERDAPVSSRRKTRRPGRSSTVPSRHLALPPPTLELLRSPIYILRALKPSEVWDEEVSGPILYAPVPLRPFREPELLLVGYNEKARDDSASTSSGTAGI